jgi:hypothetical protein
LLFVEPRDTNLESEIVGELLVWLNKNKEMVPEVGLEPT